MLYSQLYEPTHEKRDLSIVQFAFLQTCMHSNTVRPDLQLLVWSIFLFPILCERTAKALARLRGCAGSSEPFAVRICDKYRFHTSWPILLSHAFWKFDLFCSNCRLACFSVFSRFSHSAMQTNSGVKWYRKYETAWGSRLSPICLGIRPWRRDSTPRATL